MFTTNFAALPALADLTARASKTRCLNDGGQSRDQTYLVFHMLRCDTDEIAAIQTLADLGYTVTVRTGCKVRICKSGRWSERRCRTEHKNVKVKVVL